MIKTNSIENNFQEDIIGKLSHNSDLIELGKPIIGDLKNLEYHTDLTVNEIIAISNIKMIVEELKKLGIDISYLFDFIKYYMELKISYRRKSRKEFIELNKNSINNLMEDKKEIA